MTVHIISLPHTPLSEQTAFTCAYTCKVVKVARALRDLELDVEVYCAGDDIEIPAVVVMHRDAREALFGDWHAGCMPNVDWDDKRGWNHYSRKVIEAMDARVEPGDVILLPTSHPLQPVIDHFTGRCTIAELGIGYEGAVPGIPHCWESYAWRHHVYGKYPATRHDLDTVIPNPVDPDMFDVGDDHGYALFIGRVIRGKGVDRAARWATQAGLTLKIAGPGVAKVEDGRIVADDGLVVEGDVEYVGPVAPAERRKLLAHASVLMVPTRYVGPWEGVHAEALMSGVAPVVPDLGAFVETCDRQWRFEGDDEGLAATYAAIAARGPQLRDRACWQFGLPTVGLRYRSWIERLAAPITTG